MEARDRHAPPLDLEALLREREAVLRLAPGLVHDPHPAVDVAQGAMRVALEEGQQGRKPSARGFAA